MHACMFFCTKLIHEGPQDFQNIRIYAANLHFGLLTSRYNQPNNFTKQQELLQL